MKYCLTFLLLFFCFFVSAQKRSYVQVGPAAYYSKGPGGFIAGGGLGAGSSKGAAGVGINMELLSMHKQFVLPVYVDVRCYFSSKKTSPYVTLQPGYNFRNDPSTTESNLTLKDKGGIYAGVGIGLFVYEKKAPGFNVQLKYVFMQDKIVNTYQYNATTIIVTNTHAGYISLCASILF